MKDNKSINIIISGGSGFWAERNHYPAILQMKQKGIPVRVIAIVDIRKPDQEKSRPNMKAVVDLDNPRWISPFGKTPEDLKYELTSFIKQNKCNAIIVTTNPIYHYFYCAWGIENGINVMCDKPLVVNKNSSSNIESAKLIQSNFEKLEDLYKKAKKKNNKYILCTPLRRRALTPFLNIANNLQEVYEKTGEGIRYMNLINNGGLHRYPAEFLKGGAHGYLDGVGSLTHSSYHYIDIIAWYLQLAQGDAVKIRIVLTYISRVKDYLDIKGYRRIKDLIEEKPSNINDDIELPRAVLSSELDFSFHLQLLNKQNLPIGLISYTSNHTTFTPRQAKYNSDIIDSANNPLGGRMSQLYIDVHQGALQNWQLIKNDVVFYGNEITTIGRRHPKVGVPYKKNKYSEAYEKGTVSPKDLVISFVKYSGGLKISSNHFNLLSTIDNQKLTNRIFSKFYEEIAEEYERNILGKKGKEVSQIIELKDFL